MSDPTVHADMTRQLKSQGVIGLPRTAVFYGWWVVTAAAVGLFWGVPITVLRIAELMTEGVVLSSPTYAIRG